MGSYPKVFYFILFYFTELNPKLKQFKSHILDNETNIIMIKFNFRIPATSPPKNPKYLFKLKKSIIKSYYMKLIENMFLCILIKGLFFMTETYEYLGYFHFFLMNLLRYKLKRYFLVICSL